MAIASVLVGILTGLFAATVLMILGNGVLLAIGGYILGGLLGAVSMGLAALVRATVPKKPTETLDQDAATA